MISNRAQAELMKKYEPLYASADAATGVQIRNELMAGILHGLEADEIEIYLKKEYTPQQMQAVRVALEEGIPKDYVIEKIAVIGSTLEQMLTEKAHYYQTASAPGIIPEIYIKGIESVVEQLRSQISLSEGFFDQTLREYKSKIQDMENACQASDEKLKKKKKEYAELEAQHKKAINAMDALQEKHRQLEELYRESNSKAAGQQSRSGHKENGIFRRMILSLQGKKEGKKNQAQQSADWLIDLLCSTRLSPGQCLQMQRSYKAGVPKDAIIRIAKPMDDEKAAQIVTFLIDLYAPEQANAEPQMDRQMDASAINQDIENDPYDPQVELAVEEGGLWLDEEG